MMIKGSCCAALALGVSAATMPALAFPPYRSTDADVAAPWLLEARLGLLRVTRDEGQNAFTTPLLRLNLGIPAGLEVLSELEYSASDARIEDAAAGVKWVPVRGRFGFGTEVLALLPVSAAGGAGTQGLLLASYQSAPVRVHLNGGAVYDSRPVETELGWRASLLTELELGRARPGVELFMARVNEEPVQVSAGAGAILDLGMVDVRAGIHLGITDSAADLRTSIWVARAFPLVAEEERQR